MTQTIDIEAIKARADKGKIRGNTLTLIGALIGENTRGKIEDLQAIRQDVHSLLVAVEEMESENSLLSAWQCIHHDGKTGLVCMEQGHQICAKDARITALEAERDALKDALTNSCDLLESYIDTFGDMSGANRADLNDYRAVLSLADERGL